MLDSYPKIFFLKRILVHTVHEAQSRMELRDGQKRERGVVYGVEDGDPRLAELFELFRLRLGSRKKPIARVEDLLVHLGLVDVLKPDGLLPHLDRDQVLLKVVDWRAGRAST
jgi:hypothetical protein